MPSIIVLLARKRRNSRSRSNNNNNAPFRNKDESHIDYSVLVSGDQDGTGFDYCEFDYYMLVPRRVKHLLPPALTDILRLKFI
jgi:hypothetical protein